MLLAVLSQLPALALVGLVVYLVRRSDRTRRSVESSVEMELHRLRDQQAEAVQQAAEAQHRALENIVRRMQQLERTQQAHAEIIERLTAQLAHHKTALEQLGQVVQQGFTRLDAVAETLRVPTPAERRPQPVPTAASDTTWAPLPRGN